MIYSIILKCDWIWEKLASTRIQDTLFTIKQWLYTLINNSDRYWCWNLPWLFWPWFVAEDCQTFTSAWVVFKWCHHSLTSRQPAVRNSPRKWLMSLVMDLAAFCNTWRWKWCQWTPFGCFQCWHSLCLLPHGSPPPLGTHQSKNLCRFCSSWLQTQLPFSYLGICILSSLQESFGLVSAKSFISLLVE